MTNAPADLEQGALASDAAEFLNRYAAFIRTVPADDLEIHPYLPEIERVADACQALAFAQPPASGVDREAFKAAMVDAARARGGAGYFAHLIAKGETNLWLDIAYDAAAALTNSGAPVPGDEDRFASIERVDAETYRLKLRDHDSVTDIYEGGLFSMVRWCLEHGDRFINGEVALPSSSANTAPGDADGAAEALRPFALIAPHVERTDARDGEVVHRQSKEGGGYVELTKADFRRAAKALAALAANPVPGDAGGALRAAIEALANDYQTSDKHHPDHVLVPTSAFLRVCVEAGVVPHSENGMTAPGDATHEESDGKRTGRPDGSGNVDSDIRDTDAGLLGAGRDADQLVNSAAGDAGEALATDWQDIASAPKDGTRLNLCWGATETLSAHVELGKWSASKGWVNTYGKPFHGDPEFYQFLPEPPMTGAILAHAAPALGAERICREAAQWELAQAATPGIGKKTADNHRGAAHALEMVADKIAAHAAPAPSDEAAVPAGMVLVPELLAALEGDIDWLDALSQMTVEREMVMVRIAAHRDLIAKAREAAAASSNEQATPTDEGVLAEREACAKVAEERFRAGGWCVEYQRAAAYIAAAIRARSAPGSAAGEGTSS